MFWSKPKSDPFERERLLYLTQISDLRSELSELRLELASQRDSLLAEAKIERENLLGKILAIGYPRLANPQIPPRVAKPAQHFPLIPGYRPDLRPADPLEEYVAPEATEVKTVDAALASLLAPPPFATDSESTDRN
jgi:hypothetical protein